MTFLKQELIDAGFNPQEPVEGILVVEDFISDDELAAFWNIIETTPEEDWLIHYRKQLKDFCMEKFGRDDVENLVEEGKYEITQGWDDKNLLIDTTDVAITVTKRLADLIKLAEGNRVHLTFGIFQRMQEGTQLKAHTDQHTDPSIEHAAVLYLNDDYADGEVFWPNKGLELKPKPKTLIIFPGTDEYHHGVKHVGKGPIRYVMPAFIKVANFYNYNKY